MEMATGHPPWHTLNLRTPMALVNWVERNDGPPPMSDCLSPPLRRFLLRCFERDPTKRATAKQLLSDPFVANRRHGTASGRTSVSDAVGVVSEIDHLSRKDAIARIRRASCSDCSRPDMIGSYSTYAPSDGSHLSPRSNQQSRGNSSIRPIDGASGVSIEETEEPSARPLTPPSSLSERSSARGPRRPELDVVTTGLDQCAPRIMTPPSRRLSSGRSGSTSPNPFSGRRRSFEQSADGYCSPRRCTSPGWRTETYRRGIACQGDISSKSTHYDEAAGGLCSVGGRGRAGGQGTVVDVGNAMIEENVQAFTSATSVNTGRGSMASPALKRSDSFASFSSSSSCSSSTTAIDDLTEGKSLEDLNSWSYRASSLPCSKKVSGSVPQGQTTSKAKRFGRGGRPASIGGEAASDGTGHAITVGWRWRSQGVVACALEASPHS